jgi:acetyltransferase-like isoleucine patch superfamily enzyme
MRTIVSVISLFLPWPLRRLVLNSILGFDIAPSARIGFSLLICERAVLRPRSTIRHLNLIRVGLLYLEEGSTIGNLNTIQGASQAGAYFKHQPDRRAELVLGAQSAITSRHYIDCTNRILIGKFTIIGGVRTTLLTHSIDFRLNRQDSAPVTIGDYCFVGTDCTILKGSQLPSHSLLGAKALLNRAFNEPGLYGGVPAVRRSSLEDLAYMSRQTGHVY